MKIKYNVYGLDCPVCASKLAGIIDSKEGIISAKINFLTEKLTVESELSEAEAYKLICEAAKSFSGDIKIEK